MNLATGSVEVIELAGVPRHDGIVDLDRLADLIGPVDLLESADRSGWSLLVPHHLATGMLEDLGGRVTLRVGGEPSEDLGADPAAALDLACDRLGLGPAATPPEHVPVPFRGGFVGAFAYELGARLAPGGVPSPPSDVPDGRELSLRLTGVVVAVPRDRDRAVVVIDRGLAMRDPSAVLADLTDRLRRPCPSDTRRTADGPTTGRHTVLSSLPHAEHAAAVGAVLELIARGDAYQVNLAQRLTASWPADVTTLYRRLRAASPASHAALLPGIGVASASPERFLRVRGGVVSTDPIKGTRPRADDPSLDAALADDLSTSAKDRAENVMVVDLERNDLGRVCVPGTVRATALLELRALPTVWHLVSSVAGRLRPDVGYGELLRATFPSGSVTGAPRLAAMRAIGRLEPVRRGWYCGAIGFLGAGDAELSVAIRTATVHPDGRVTYGAGGGIVADSEADAEIAESLDKAAPFLRAIGALGGDRRVTAPDALGAGSA